MTTFSPAMRAPSASKDPHRVPTHWNAVFLSIGELL